MTTIDIMSFPSHFANSTTMDEEASSSSSSFQMGSNSPAIDRYNPIIRDPTRLGRIIPSPPPPPLDNQKPNDYSAVKINNNNNKVKKKKQQKFIEPNKDEKREGDVGGSIMNNGRRSWSCMKPGGFISPPGSSRYLLSEKAFLNVLSDFDPVLKLVPPEPSKSVAVKKFESADSLQSSSPPAPDQVVVLRVSLHCRGCERKMRKHISRMEGVSSFNIDFAAKKVTVVGNVTPLGVLASISKVKTAQLLTPPITQTNSEVKKPEPTFF